LVCTRGLAYLSASARAFTPKFGFFLQLADGWGACCINALRTLLFLFLLALLPNPDLKLFV
jgi:hypothetical protein